MATTSRFIPGANQDNTLRVVTRDYQTPAYAAAITVNITAEKTLVKVGLLTGAMTVNFGVGSSTLPPYVGDEIELLFVADTTQRTVTIGTGAAGSASTLVVAISKYGSLKFKFNGTVWQETDRTITA